MYWIISGLISTVCVCTYVYSRYIVEIRFTVGRDVTSGSGVYSASGTIPTGGCMN